MPIPRWPKQRWNTCRRTTPLRYALCWTNLLSEQFAAMGNAQVRRAGVQLVVGESACRNRDDGHTNFACGVNIRGSISNKQTACSSTELLLNMIDSALENSCAGLTFIAEISENEEFPQAGGFDLVPANRFKIARCHSDKLSCSLQRF